VQTSLHQVTEILELKLLAKKKKSSKWLKEKEVESQDIIPLSG